MTAPKYRWVWRRYHEYRTVETPVEIITWIGLAGMEYRSAWDGAQRVAEAHVVAVVVPGDRVHVLRARIEAAL